MPLTLRPRADESPGVPAQLPAWPLLFWSGLVATVICVWMLGALVPDAGARALAPFARRAAPLQALVLGVLVYPILYAVPFQLLHRATLPTGALLGLLHALLLFAPRSARTATDRPALLWRAGTVVLYGAILGFTYLTP